MSSVAVIVPCYNEEKRIQESEFISFLQVHPDIQVYFVNDGSTDNTEQVLLRIQKSVVCKIITLEKNTGKAEAIRTGFLSALQDQHLLIGYLDADLSTELNEFLNLRRQLEERNVDMVLGSRIKKIDTVIERSFFRHIVGRMIATLIDQKFRLGVYDTQCGAKIFQSSIIETAIGTEFYTKWFFDVELLLRVRKFNPEFTASEVPLFKWINARNSKLSVASFPLILKDVFVLLTKYYR